MTVYPQHLQGPSSVPGLLAGIIVPEIVCSFVVIGRIYSRGILIKNWGWDDTLICIAWIYSLTVVTLVGVETRFGLGHQHKNIPLSFQAIAIKCSYFTIICYQLCLILTKVSILFFYLRILKLRLQRLLIWTTMGFVCTYGAILLPLSALVCNPVTQHFPFFPNAVTKCFSYYPIMTASAILHTTTDVWLIALILPHVLKMQLPKKQKFGLIFLLTLGLFDACASLTRISVAYQFLNPKLAQWDSFSFAIWTTLETSLGILCASVPMLRPLVRKIMGVKPEGEGRGMVNGNVPRSKSRRERAQIREFPEDFWWSDDRGSYAGFEQEMQDHAMPKKEFLTVHVIDEFGSERSESVGSGGGGVVVAKSASTV